MPVSKKKAKAKRAYIRESLRIWQDNPEMQLHEFKARRPTYYNDARAEIRRLGLEHERICFCARSNKC